MLIGYNGGSRHTALKKKLGVATEKPVDWQTDFFHEKEYLYQGWNCLAFYGVAISQFPQSHVLCPINSTQAVYIYGDGQDAAFEKLLSTVRLIR